MLRFALSAVLLCSFAVTARAADEDEKTWEGTWVNKAFNTTGRLKCVTQPQKDGNYKATFTGTFRGRDFKYNVTFKAKAGKGQKDLSGDATISGAKYEWTGTIKGDTLTGRYKADNGYNGTFVVKTKAKK